MSPSGSRSLVARVCLVLLGGVCLYGLVRFARDAAACLRSPFSLDYGEGCVLALVQLLARRGTYFTSYTAYPFVHGIYPPLFPLLALPGYEWLGPSLAFPRALSDAATLALLLTVFLLLRRGTGRPLLAGAFALMVLAPWFVVTWAPLARVDMLGCFLSIAGIAAYAAWGATSLLPAFVLFWLAFFTKQNALIAPAAVLLHLLLVDRRRFPKALALFALPLAALFGALVLLTGGAAFRHLVLYTAAAEYQWGRMLASYGDFLAITAPLALLILAGLAILKGSILRGRAGLLVLYWLLSLLGLSAIAKQGAAQNYFIEPYLATLLAAAFVLAELLDRFPRLESAWAAYALAAALTATLVGHAEARLPQALRHPAAATDFVALDEAVKAAQGPVLSENLAVLVTNRRTVWVEPFGFALLAKHGYVRSEPVVEDCERQRFALVVAEKRLAEIPGLAACLRSEYAPWKTLGPYRLLLPRER